MTGRNITISTVVLFVVVLALAVCFAPRPTPLPATVERQLERHAIASAVDTAETNRLERAKAGDSARAQELAAGRRRRLDSAAAAGRLADSLAQVASTPVQTPAVAVAPDPAVERWKAAYDARTAEAVQLRTALETAGAELQARAAQQAASDSIAAVWHRHALRADSLVATLVDVAKQGDRCRVAWLLPCPTRTQVAIGGVLVGAAGVALATGKIRIPIALRF